MREDSFVSSSGADRFSDSDQPPSCALSDTAPPPLAELPSPPRNHVDRAQPAILTDPEKPEPDLGEKGAESVPNKELRSDSLMVSEQLKTLLWLLSECKTRRKTLSPPENLKS